jgi:predicted small metal-binding protein
MTDDIIDDPLARIRALQSPETRARLDLMERVNARFLRLDRDDKLATVFQDLLDDLTVRADPKLPEGAGNRREGGTIVLIGESGAGKSLSLKRLVGRHRAFPGYMVPRSGCAAVYVRVPSFCTPKALGRITLRQLGLPIKGNPPSHIVWEMVYQRIEELQKVVLHFDEMHNVTKYASDDEIDDIRNMIKTLVVSPTWPIVLIISGLPEIVDLTQPITEIRRRCRHMEFRSLVLPDGVSEIESAIADLAITADMPVKTTMHDALAPRLIHAALYQIGTSIEVAQEAICIALKEHADGLTRDHFKDAYTVRTGCLPTENPFVMTDWASIDCTAVLGRHIEKDQENGENDESPARKGKRQKKQRKRQ